MTQPSGDETTRPLPDIPECDVELLDDGRIRVRHRTTAQAVTVASEREARLAGIRLRIQADRYDAAGEMHPIPLPWAGTAPEFRAGYLP